MFVLCNPYIEITCNLNYSDPKAIPIRILKIRNAQNPKFKICQFFLRIAKICETYNDVCINSYGRSLDGCSGCVYPLWSYCSFLSSGMQQSSYNLCLDVVMK